MTDYLRTAFEEWAKTQPPDKDGHKIAYTSDIMEKGVKVSTQWIFSETAWSAFQAEHRD